MLDEFLTKYLALREKKAQIKAEYDAKVGRIDDMLAQCEQHLLEKFNEIGTDSVSVKGVGTAYKSTRTSASVADKEAFRQFILDNDLWQLADLRASKVAVEEFKQANGDLPPGINYSQQLVINVRKG